MQAPAPGLYPDPNGDWELRFWDGQAWTEHVRTGAFMGVAALEPPLVPDVEQNVWGDGRHLLTTHRWFPKEHTGSAPVQIPLWSVADVEVRITAGSSLAGVGSVVAVVAYPGYTDRRHWVAPGVVDVHRVAAYVRLWANRNRRAAWPQGH